jgi:protein involved in polysaccharide export with SLBB domain
MVPRAALYTTLVVGLVFSFGALSRRCAAQGDTASESVKRAMATHPQPGDRVFLHVLREPKLSDSVTVDERGEIVLPKIGVLNASSMTVGALRDTVRGRFAEFLRDSPIELAVLRPVTVNGAIARTGVYYIDVTTTLRDLIARAGGLAWDGDEHKVAIIRGANRVPVPDWQDDRSAGADLRSGDQVVVGRKSWLALNLVSAVSVVTGLAYLVITIARR